MQNLLKSLEKIYIQQPQQIALQSSDGRSWTYKALWEQVSAIGSGLIQNGIMPGERIAIAYGQEPEFILALLSCWWAGAVWLPIANLPEQRQSDLLKRTETRYLLGSEHLTLDQLQNPHTTSIKPAFEPDPSDPAYLIFTSGSTGLPKGVLIPHGGIVTMLKAQIELFGLHSQSRCLWLLSPLFDASVSDIGTALLSGATLVIDSQPTQSLQKFYSLLQRYQITSIDLPPSLLGLLDQNQMPSSLQTLIIGGEPAAPEQIDKWSLKLRLINVYGPTEATVCTSAQRCEPGQSQLIGQPLPGVIYALDGEIPIPGNSGELWISSPGLALGYWHDPDLTQQRFVKQDGLRWYRSGDRVSYTQTREYRFEGRIDRQFKQHGRLICPEEIEAALLKLPGISRAAVFQHSSGALTAALAGEQITQAILNEALSASLPAWMIPSLLIWPENFPITASGKADFQRLSNWDLSIQTENSEPITNLSPKESLLAGIWQQLLKQPVNHPDADFFALGGSSIQVLTCVALASDLGLKLTPESFYQGRSLKQILKLQGLNQAYQTDDLLKSLPANLPQQPALAIRPRAEKLLLTGATGFLGSHLLAELLQTSETQIHCLVRSGSPEQAMLRLEQALIPWKVKLNQDRVSVSCVDLSQPDFKLSEELKDSLTAVLHCAAQVDLVRDYSSLYAANVAAVARLAGLGRAFHFVSSLSVFVAAEPKPTQADEQYDLSQSLAIHGGYAASKWAADAWLLKQQPKAWIYRPGLVTGDSQTAYAPERDWLRWLLKGLLELDALPELTNSPLAVDITPVDYVAKSILALMQGPAGVFHLANPQALALTDLLDELADWSGIKRLPLPQWQAKAQQRLRHQTSPDSSAALLALCRVLDSEYWQSLDLFQATGIKLTSEATQTRLSAQGLHCPAADRQLLRRYFKVLA